MTRMLADLEADAVETEADQNVETKESSPTRSVKRNASKKKGTKRAMLDWIQNALSKRFHFILSNLSVVIINSFYDIFTALLLYKCFSL